MNPRYILLSSLLLFILLVPPLQGAAAFQTYSEEIVLQAVGEDIYAELNFQGDNLNICDKLTPENFTALNKVSLWAVRGSPPETITWTDLPRLPPGLTLLAEFPPELKGKAQSQLSELLAKIEEVFHVEFFEMSDLWDEVFKSEGVEVFYSPTDFHSYLKTYSAFIPTEYGGFTKLVNLDLYKTSKFSMLGVEFQGGTPTVKLRLIHVAEASVHRFEALKAGVKESFNYKGLIEPSKLAEASTVKVKVKGGIILDALLPNLTVRPEGTLEGNFTGIGNFPNIYAIYKSEFQKQPRLKVVKVVDRVVWNQEDLVKVTIYLTNVGGGTACNLYVDDSQTIINLSGFTLLREGSPITTLQSLNPGSTAEVSYVLLVESLPPEKYVKLEPARVTYTDEAMLNLYEASSNSLFVGLGASIASVIPILETECFEAESGGTVEASLKLINIGEAPAYNVRVLVQGGEEWKTWKVEEISAGSSTLLNISTKIYGVSPLTDLNSSILISYFSKGTPEISTLTVTANSAKIHLKTLGLPQVKISKTVEKETCKVRETLETRINLAFQKVTPQTVTIYEKLSPALSYQEGDLTPTLGAPSILKAEVHPSGGEASLTYTVKVEKPDILVYVPTIALVRVSPNLPPLTFYAEEAPLVAASPLSLSKSFQPQAEGSLKIVVSATNQSSVPLTNVKLEDWLPRGVKLVEGTLTAEQPLLKPGETLNLTYLVKPSKLEGEILPKAKASYSFLHKSFQQFSAEIRLKLSPKVALEKTFDVQTPILGSPVTITVRLTNMDASPLSNVKIVDKLPEGFKLKEGTLTMEAQALNPGENLVLTYVATPTVDGSFTLPKAEAYYTYFGLPLKVEAAGGRLTIGPKLLLGKSIKPFSIKPGEPATVTITIKNAGVKLEMLNVRVRDELPPEARLLEGSPELTLSSLPPEGLKLLIYSFTMEKAGIYPLPQPTATYSFPQGGELTVKAEGKVSLIVAGAAPSPTAPAFPATVLMLAPLAVAAAATLAIIIVKKRRGKARIEEEEFL